MNTEGGEFVVVDHAAPLHRCTFPGGQSVALGVQNHPIARASDDRTIIRCICGQRWIAGPARRGGYWWSKISAFGAWRGNVR